MRKVTNPYKFPLKERIKTAFKLLYSGESYSALLFNSKNLPTEGDTITIGNLVAEFKKPTKKQKEQLGL